MNTRIMKILLREWNFVTLLRYREMIPQIILNFPMLFKLHRNVNANTGDIWIYQLSYLEKYLIKRSFIVMFWKHLNVSYKNIKLKMGVFN